MKGYGQKHMKHKLHCCEHVFSSIGSSCVGSGYTVSSELNLFWLVLKVTVNLCKILFVPLHWPHLLKNLLKEHPWLKRIFKPSKNSRLELILLVL